MAKKMVTWDYERHQWLVQANSADDGSDWYFYQRCRTPLVKMPGNTGWYRPERSHIPKEYGFNYHSTIRERRPRPLAAISSRSATPSGSLTGEPVLWPSTTTVSPGTPCLWNIGTNSITLSLDETKLYLVVIAVPKPMKIGDRIGTPTSKTAGVQFPYTVSFTNATPKNVIYPVQSHGDMHAACKRRRLEIQVRNR